jgi:hypothetical protein
MGRKVENSALKNILKKTVVSHMMCCPIWCAASCDVFFHVVCCSEWCALLYDTLSCVMWCPGWCAVRCCPLWCVAPVWCAVPEFAWQCWKNTICRLDSWPAVSKSEHGKPQVWRRSDVWQLKIGNMSFRHVITRRADGCCILPGCLGHKRSECSTWAGRL